MTLEIPSCSGYCEKCGTVHVVPAGPAVLHARDLMDRLMSSGRLDFDSPIPDPRFSTESLYGESRGKMFGVLVGENERGEEVVLRAFSCQHDSVWELHGWVPPLVDSIAYMKIMDAGSAILHRMTDEIHALPRCAHQRTALVHERKELSQKIQRELFDMYEVRNFLGETRSLADAFYVAGVASGAPKAIPTGTGDCCAPKLLNHAARLGLKPQGIAEFFWGKENRSHTRTEGHFYPPCTNRCEPILGYMLCGSNHA